jgi:hypothetical protein
VLAVIAPVDEALERDRRPVRKVAPDTESEVADALAKVVLPATLRVWARVRPPVEDALARKS